MLACFTMQAHASQGAGSFPGRFLERQVMSLFLTRSVLLASNDVVMTCIAYAWPCLPRDATCRNRCTYMRHRHKLVLAQRMLRLMHMLVSVYQSCEELQAALARALDAGKATSAAVPTLRVAVLNLTRPLGLGPMITMSQVSAVLCRLREMPATCIVVLHHRSDSDMLPAQSGVALT